MTNLIPAKGHKRSFLADPTGDRANSVLSGQNLPPKPLMFWDVFVILAA